MTPDEISPDERSIGPTLRYMGRAASWSASCWIRTCKNIEI